MMKKYYYSDGSNKFGPYTLEELKNFNLTKDTLVWYEDLTDWTPAGQLDELKILFEENITPIVTEKTQQGGTFDQNQNTQTKPKTYLVEAILATLLCAWPLGLIGIINATKVNKAFDEGRYEDALQASKAAKNWTLASVITALVLVVMYVIFIVALGEF